MKTWNYTMGWEDAEEPTGEAAAPEEGRDTQKGSEPLTGPYEALIVLIDALRAIVESGTATLAASDRAEKLLEKIADRLLETELKEEE